VLPGVPGFLDLDPGDRVIVGLQGQRGTGVARITSIQFPVANPGAAASGHQAGAALTNVIAQVVDVDADARRLTVRLAGMGDRVLQVSDSVAGLSDLSRGDRIRIAIADDGSSARDVVTEISAAPTAARGLATPARGHLGTPGGVRPGTSAPGSDVPSPTPTASPASPPAGTPSPTVSPTRAPGTGTGSVPVSPVPPQVAAGAPRSQSPGSTAPSQVAGASTTPHASASGASTATLGGQAVTATGGTAPPSVGTPVQVLPGAPGVAPAGPVVGGSFFGTGPGVAGPGTPAPNVVAAPAGAAGPGVALPGTATGVTGTTAVTATTAAPAATVAGATAGTTATGGTVTAAPGTAISGGFGGPPAEGIGLGAGIFTTPAVTPVAAPLVSETANAPAAATASSGAAPDSLALAEVRSQMGARDLSSRLATFAQRADEIDRLWMRYRAACEVEAGATAGMPRAWFVLWEGGGTPVRAMDACDDYYDEIVRHGEALKVQVSAAEDGARSAGVMPGTIRDLFAAYSLDWGGWDLPRPAPRRR
jgi:hypothetical protein